MRTRAVCKGTRIGWSLVIVAAAVLCAGALRATGQDYAWGPLGTGMGGTSPYVNALTVYNGELIAGGYFSTAGGATCTHIARWNGSAWQALGSGMNDAVYALAVYNGELVAGGTFTTAGAVPCNFIARWNGSAWQALGAGMNYYV